MFQLWFDDVYIILDENCKIRCFFLYEQGLTNVANFGLIKATDGCKAFTTIEVY